LGVSAEPLSWGAVSDDVLEARPPDVPLELAVEIARTVFGVEGNATSLDGERDRNFRIDGTAGSFVLKVANPADPADVVEMQVLAMEHALRADTALPTPHPRRTIDRRPIGSVTIDGLGHAVQLVALIDGKAFPSVPVSPTTHRAVGAAVARLDQALAGFTHPLARRPIQWDVTRLPALRAKLDGIADAMRRALVERWLDRFDAVIAPALALVPSSTIHGDVNPGNLLVDQADPELLAGIVDFGDVVHAPTVIDLAIAAAYQAFGAADPLDPLVEVATAYHAVRPLTAAEVALVPELAGARMAQSVLISAWRAELHPDNVDYILSDQEDCFETLARIDDRGPVTLAASLAEACGIARPTSASLEASLALRRARLGPALSLTYDNPVRLVSGNGVWLADAGGNELLDAYNNVPQVGHAHPRVTAALSGQARRLSTNTRYLVDEVAVYADRLVGLLPDGLSVVMFVNSGSEANDVAIQIARAVTGNRGVVITEHAYHGTTAATAALSPEELGPDALEPWVERIGGKGTLGAPDAAARVSGEVDDAFARLRAREHDPALLVYDDVFASDGIFAVPPGYLRAAYARARAVGALCLADEVQAGFGRVGTPFWGFAQDGVVPDLVTLGKPMGNGHPMGAVITTPSIAAEFAARWHFFSTFAGSPVAAAVGTAVLDVIERERLAEQAERVGSYLRERLGEVAVGQTAIRQVRGPGLFIGVELDGESSGRPDIGKAVANGLRCRGVLVGTTGPLDNVIKIRPPLVFAEQHADRVTAALDATLTEELR
jgi:4-aminobutyrate aminotransferase-like enzyme/Ser/Thr protein kinase RdoA (MazF antagonist)